MISLSTFRPSNWPLAGVFLALGLFVNCGGSGSKAAPVPPVPAPVITTQPQSVMVNDGKMVTLSVVATGSDLTYSWRKDASPIPDLSSAATYAFTATSADDGARYSVEVSNAGGRVVSQEAVLTVSANFTDLIQNGSFENLATDGNADAWTFSDAKMTIQYSAFSLSPIPGGGAYVLANGAWGEVKTDAVYQTVAIPALATQANLTFKLTILNTTTWTTAPGSPVNTCQVKIQDASGKDLQTLVTKTDNDVSADGSIVWNAESFDLSAYKGQTIRIAFTSNQTDAAKDTAFVTDLVSLLVK